MMTDAQRTARAQDRAATCSHPYLDHEGRCAGDEFCGQIVASTVAPERIARATAIRCDTDADFHEAREEVAHAVRYSAGQAVLDRQLHLAAIEIAPSRCDHVWCERDHSAEPYGVHPHHSGFDLAVCPTCNPPSLAPSGTD